tara:strand:- start:625 stop:846 length:222 start_codon:yes stop_codon:yes gene_type:complete
MNSVVYNNFYKNIDNKNDIQLILKQYEVAYEKESDVEFFDELQNGILEDYPNTPNLATVLERILIYLVNRDLG